MLLQAPPAKAKEVFPKTEFAFRELEYLINDLAIIIADERKKIENLKLFPIFLRAHELARDSGALKKQVSIHPTTSLPHLPVVLTRCHPSGFVHNRSRRPSRATPSEELLPRSLTPSRRSQESRMPRLWLNWPRTLTFLVPLITFFSSHLFLLLFIIIIYFRLLFCG